MTMTSVNTAQSRSTAAARTTPPWLWAWLGGYLLASMPLEISLLHFLTVTYFGQGGTLSEVSGSGIVTVERLSLISSLLIYVVILSGAVAALFPHLRGRWVEWRFKLARDDRPVMAEMQQFVSSHDPSISLRITIRSDQMARLYPVGWRSARIAVFRPLPALWRRDREAAEAILLHEVAHRRQGDQLIAGLGSPFVMLMRLWVPAYLLLVLIPALVYLAASGGIAAQFIAVSSITQVGVIPGQVFLPVTALWLAELGADQLAAQAIGSDAVRHALQATEGSRASLVARALALLSHPPRRLRLRLATARPGATAALVAVWPAALVVWLLVLPLAIEVLALFLLGFPVGQVGPLLRAATPTVLAYGRPLAIATAVLLLAWPVLAYPWERLWSAAPRPSHRLPWWPYLAAAILPVAMLAVSLVPLKGSLPGPSTGLTTPQLLTEPCEQFTSWQLGEGGAAESTVETDINQLPINATSIAATTAQKLDSAIRAALDDPPPGAARSPYTQAMADFEDTVTDLQHGNGSAANTAINNGLSRFFAASKLLTTQCSVP